VSSHEIEDVIEASVRVIDKAELDPRFARDLIANLYRYQLNFDCGHTHGRVTKILMARRYLLALPMSEHPESKTFAALFKYVAGRKWCSLHEAHKPSGQRGLYAFCEQNAVVAWGPDDVVDADDDDDFEHDDASGVYSRAGGLQIEAGCALWQRLVDGGRFTGFDAVAPELMAPPRACAAIVAAAEEQNQHALISNWYAVLPFFVEACQTPAELAALRDDDDAKAILATVERTRAFELRSDWGYLRVPRPDALHNLGEQLRAVAPFWYALDWSLPPPRDRKQVVGAAVQALGLALEAGTLPAQALARAIEQLGEFDDWSSFMILFMYGFGYSMGDRDFAARIKRSVDFSASPPRVNDAVANAELALQPAAASPIPKA
jgi:hypothetical protein